MRGPDAVLLRVPRGGGRVSAVVYPRLDSVVWRSRESAPALAQVLDFDADGGLVAALDTGGLPVRVDLRLGTARLASKSRLRAVVAAGATFYGVDSGGAVTRLTEAGGGAWRVRLTPSPDALLPQRDGTVLAAGSRGGTGVLWVLRPPGTRATDSVRVPGGARAVRLERGDRVYFAGGEELLGVQGRTLAAAAPVSLGAPLRAAATSPSGDRLYVLTTRPGELLVVDRYAGAVKATLQLPGAGREVRVDPLGRYLLVRPESGDSAWVVAAGTERVVGVVRGTWRADLPAVLPDGAVLAAVGDDVSVVDGETLRPRATVTGGASDFWHLVIWNGFRPRAAGLDQPVRFARPEAGGAEPGGAAQSAAAADPASDGTADAALDDSVEVAPDSAGPAGGRPARPTVPPPDGAPAAASIGAAGGEVALAGTASARQGAGRASRVYTVQFAAAPTEAEARRVLARLRVPNTPLRVVPRTFDGRTVYRVVAGPFATRAEAEQAGRAAGVGNYWVREGAP
jgi:cell division septation protein DedD